MPRYLLGRGELQFRNTKAGARGVLGATLDFVKVAGVLDGLLLVHVGLLQTICSIAWRYRATIVFLRLRCNSADRVGHALIRETVKDALNLPERRYALGLGGVGW